MHVPVRSWLTAGISLAGITALAITPVSPAVGPDVQVPATSSAAVSLTASADDFFTPWVSALNAGSDNATKIAQNYLQAPGAAIQQLFVNQTNYTNTLLNNPSAIGDVFNSVGTNMENVFRGLTMLYPMDVNNENDVYRLLATNDGIHAAMTLLLPTFLGESMDEQTLQLVSTAVQFIASPLAGVMIGLAGPIASPVVAAFNIAKAVIDDPSSALQTLIGAPAAVVGAFFNGATLDLTNVVVPLLAGAMPEGISITHLDLAFGGLLTAGATADNLDDPYSSSNGIGGSIFNSLGLAIDLGGFALPITSNPVGPIGALANLSHIIAKELGWDGNGNPLAKLTFPKITPPAPALATPSGTITANAPEKPQVTADPTALAAGAATKLDAPNDPEKPQVQQDAPDPVASTGTQLDTTNNPEKPAKPNATKNRAELGWTTKKSGDQTPKVGDKAGNRVHKATGKAKAAVSGKKKAAPSHAGSTN